MRTFQKVADTGSFTAAADRLDMTPQLASKYVRAQEDETGAQLFHRSTRHVTLSDKSPATASAPFNQGLAA